MMMRLKEFLTLEEVEEARGDLNQEVSGLRMIRETSVRGKSSLRFRARSSMGTISYRRRLSVRLAPSWRRKNMHARQARLPSGCEMFDESWGFGRRIFLAGRAVS
jgi:hypothetical protein